MGFVQPQWLMADRCLGCLPVHRAPLRSGRRGAAAAGSRGSWGRACFGPPDLSAPLKTEGGIPEGNKHPGGPQA